MCRLVWTGRREELRGRSMTRDDFPVAAAKVPIEVEDLIDSTYTDRQHQQGRSRAELARSTAT
jgi:hypothetical protein